MYTFVSQFGSTYSLVPCNQKNNLRTRLELEPIWDNNKDSIVFIQQRTAVLAVACVVFGLAYILQIWWIRRQQAMEQQAVIYERVAENQQDPLDNLVPPTLTSIPPSTPRYRLKYKDYVLVSAVVNSCLLGGLVFGFPGLVLLLRREGVYAQVCSCG